MKPVVEEFAKCWNEVLPGPTLWRQGSLIPYNNRVKPVSPVYNPKAGWTLEHYEKMWLSS